LVELEIDMKRYRIPAREIQTEITVKNSLFIATLSPVFTVNAAKLFIKKVKANYSDASHNVPAFIVGHGASVTAHCNDDGEPAGTAGRPTLAVLQGSNLGDAALVITRYFGGTKLGKGGLVRAYSDAARSVLSIAPLAERLPTHVLLIVIPYNLYNQFKILIQRYHGKIESEIFTNEISINCRIMVEFYQEFQDSLKEMSHGKIRAKFVETDPATIVPLNEFPDSKQI
jgi:uncharacterized YigZ family protein